VGSLVVVVVDERVELCLEFNDGCRGGLGAEPLLHRLLESFDFAAGGWMVRSAVLLTDSVFDEFVLEAVAAGAPEVGEAGGEDQTVVGQGGERDPVFGDGVAEGGHDGGSGDALVGGDGECVAGVVVEPGEDLDVLAVGEAVVGEVGLPGFVGLFGLEADVGGLRFLLRLRDDKVVSAQDPVDRRSGDGDVVVVLEVPADRVGAGIEALGAESPAKSDNQLDGGGGCGIGAGAWSS